MARFHYRMQSILDIKEKLESRAKQQFQAAQAKLDEEQEKMKILHDRKKRYILEGHELLTSKIDLLAIRENKNALRQIDEYIKHQQVAVVVASKNLDKARNALQEVMQERKTHEKLKEKAFNEFLLEEDRRESKEIDELVSYRHGQKTFKENELDPGDDSNFPFY